jgi:putative ABC transport system permease protein
MFVYVTIKNFTETNLGFNPNDVVVVRLNHPKVRESYELFKSEILRNPDVYSISASSNIPAVGGWQFQNIKLENDQEANVIYISIDADFTKNMEIKTLEGRSFDPKMQTDVRHTFLLNKKAVEELGLQNPVGKSITLFKMQDGESVPDVNGQIVGVIDDYAYRPAYDNLKGVIFSNDPNRYNTMLIRINPARHKETMTMIKESWSKLFRDVPLTCDLLEDKMKADFGIQLFRSLQKFIMMAVAFSLIIALLGLLGISIFSARQRIKEIGIRRANGASFIEMLILLNRKLIVLIMLSIIIGFPTVYLILNEIRKNNDTLPLIYYALAFLLILMLSTLTVSWQSWKTAKLNPAEALRHE